MAEILWRKREENLIKKRFLTSFDPIRGIVNVVPTDIEVYIVTKVDLRRKQFRKLRLSANKLDANIF